MPWPGSVRSPPAGGGGSIRRRRGHGEHRQDFHEGKRCGRPGRRTADARDGGQPEQRGRPPLTLPGSVPTTRPPCSRWHVRLRDTPTLRRRPDRRSASTAVQAVHLSRIGTIEAVERAKGELLESLPSDGTAVLNADDPIVTRMDRRTAHATATGSPPMPTCAISGVSADCRHALPVRTAAGDGPLRSRHSAACPSTTRSRAWRSASPPTRPDTVVPPELGCRTAPCRARTSPRRDRHRRQLQRVTGPPLPRSSYGEHARPSRGGPRRGSSWRCPRDRHPRSG
jgi:hypothetical protein